MTLGRSVVAIVVIAMHIMLILFLNAATRSSVIIAVNNIVSYMVIVPNQKRPVIGVASEQRYPIAARTIPVPTTQSLEIQDIAGKTESPQVNWDTAATQAARDYVKQHPQQREPSTSDQKLSIFENESHLPPNVRQSGGKIVQWISSKCYLTIRDGELDSGPPYNGARIQKTCILSKPDGEMLNRLKPEYLKKPVEDICPKNVMSCDHKK